MISRQNSFLWWSVLSPYHADRAPVNNPHFVPDSAYLLAPVEVEGKTLLYVVFQAMRTIISGKTTRREEQGTEGGINS